MNNDSQADNQIKLIFESIYRNMVLTWIVLMVVVAEFACMQSIDQSSQPHGAFNWFKSLFAQKGFLSIHDFLNLPEFQIFYTSSDK